ncbi:MAG: PPC domain-containing protein [Planctomycetaceae bacterium]
MLGGTGLADAQTSYPMLMALKPAAVQVGQTAELELESRYSMFGAYQVLISGAGVTGEIATPMQPGADGKNPDLTKIKLRITAAADAAPGVRDFRIAGPTGPSTVGQLVVVSDPVVVETDNNDTAAALTPIAWPATLCGTLEKAEDVDCFRFTISAPTVMNFHCRAMRLEDRIHDLQAHVDPILTIKNVQTGATVAAADNTYAADPFLSASLAPGEYWLEIRDVRYQGNPHWAYVVEMHNRPFITQVFPLGIAAGQPTELQPVGFNLADTAPLPMPLTTSLGHQFVTLKVGETLANPVELEVSDLPQVVEASVANNTPAEAQSVTLPCGISGRLETESDVDCFAFDAKAGDKVNVEVIARRHWSAVDSLVRILNADGAALVENDDFARWGKRNSQDSAIEGWAAPADGKYIVELRDVHARGGAPYVYFVRITPAKPDFELLIDTDKTWVTPGTCAAIFVRARRINGFEGPIDLHIDGLPAGVTAHCGRILSGGGPDGCIVLEAAADAPMSAANVSITGTFKSDSGETLTRTAVPFQETYMPGGGRNHVPVEMHTVGIGKLADLRNVELSTYELRLKPGESKRIDVKLTRTEGFAQNVTLDVLYQHLGSIYGNSLPAGVSLDAKNCTLLLSGGESQGYLTLTADASAKPVEAQQCCVMANVSINFVMKATYASRPLRISIDAP